MTKVIGSSLGAKFLDRLILIPSRSGGDSIETARKFRPLQDTFHRKCQVAIVGFRSVSKRPGSARLDGSAGSTLEARRLGRLNARRFEARRRDGSTARIRIARVSDERGSGDRFAPGGSARQHGSPAAWRRARRLSLPKLLASGGLEPIGPSLRPGGPAAALLEPLFAHA